ncbi:unnamed protein product, partial [Urochloa humidicola]
GKKEHGLCLRIKIWTCATLICVSVQPDQLGPRPSYSLTLTAGPHALISVASVARREERKGVC